MEVDASSTTGSRNPSPSLPEEAKTFMDKKPQEVHQKGVNEVAENTAAAKCSELVANGGTQVNVETSSTVDNGQDTVLAGVSVEGSVASGSCEGSVASGSREGSVAGGSREGSVASDSREGSVAGGSREGSVASDSHEGSASREGSVAGAVVTEAMLQEEQRLLENEVETGSKEVPEEVSSKGGLEALLLYI